MHSTAVPATAILGDPAEARDLGGLLGLTDRGEVPFPLALVHVRSFIVGRFARTVVEQTFRNPHAGPLEAVHIFPLPPDGAVVEMELRCGSLVVRAECREREDAERRYDEARQAGRRAGLLTAERRDVHTLHVTNIPPREEVTVRIVLIERLEEEDGAVEWRFPTVVAPRYVPGKARSHRGDGVVPDTDRVPDASRITPPIRLKGGTTLDLEVEIAGALASIASSLHAVKASFGASLRIAPSTSATLDRDFVLRFEPAAGAGQVATAYTDGQHTAVMLMSPSVGSAPRLARDAVFVMDVSGSMSGQKMEAARRAMKAAVRGLESGDRFKLIAFDTSHTLFASDFVAFDDVTLGAADTWIDQLEAGGGTELLRPLLDALSGETPVGRLRTVLVITDGEVGNEDELATAIARHRGRALVFTAGIDTAVNESLLKRIARLGGGTCELMTPADDIEGRIAALEARLAQPSAWDVRLEGGDAARPEAITLFAGRAVFALIAGAPEMVTVVGQTASGSWRTQAVPEQVSVPLGALWARERIAWLEDQAAADPGRAPMLKHEIVPVALKHGIATRHTAFVAVEETTSVSGERVTIVQPVEMPAMWEREDAVMACLAAPAPSADMASAGPCDIAYMEADAADWTFASMRAPSPPAPQTRRISFKHARPPAASPVFGKETATRPAARDPRRDLESQLSLSQRADGSWDGDVTRTAACLMALLVLGHSRRSGSRRRVVQKAATWLTAHAQPDFAAVVLTLLDRLEADGTRPFVDELAGFERDVRAALGDEAWQLVRNAAAAR